MESFDEATVKRCLRQIMQKYDPSKVEGALKKKKGGEQRLPLVTEDSLKQRDILLRSGVSTSASVAHINLESSKDVQRMQSELAVLTSECNECRIEKASYERRVKMLTGKVEMLEKEVGKPAGEEVKVRKRTQETPYTRRLAQSKSEHHLTKVKAWRNQLPPPQAGVMVPTVPRGKHKKAGTGTREEKKFDQLLASLDSTREMMEQQGFKMGKLHADVEEMVEERAKALHHEAERRTLVETAGTTHLSQPSSGNLASPSSPELDRA